MDIKNTIKKTAISAKNHLDRNRVAYGMGVVAVAAVALQQANLKAFYQFLEEKGIDPMEYYAPEAHQELVAS